MWHAIETLHRLPADGRRILCERLGVDDAEIQRWDHVSRRIHLPFRADGIFEQFDALFARLGFLFGRETIRRTIDYYLKRSAHDSTLSRVADSWVLARADRPRSWDVFQEALLSAVADIQGGTTPEGVHLGAMAGTVDVLQRCSTGLSLRGDVLWLNPRLPDALRCLRLFVRYRGHSREVAIHRERVEVNAVRCAAPRMRVGVRDEVHELAAGETRAFMLPPR